MKKIYLIPGLGADERVFDHYRFPGIEKVVIIWEAPFKNESLVGYAKRLILQIADEEPVIVGVSFGGMIAVEIGNLLTKSRIILISTVTEYHEISYFVRLLARSNLIRIIPNWLLKRPNGLIYWVFGVSDLLHKKQLAAIIRNTCPSFLKWAIGSIGYWRGQLKKDNYLRIHGNSDRLLPLKGKADYVVAGGGHFMVVERAGEIEEQILIGLKVLKKD